AAVDQRSLAFQTLMSDAVADPQDARTSVSIPTRDRKRAEIQIAGTRDSAPIPSRGRKGAELPIATLDKPAGNPEASLELFGKTQAQVLPAKPNVPPAIAGTHDSIPIPTRDHKGAETLLTGTRGPAPIPSRGRKGAELPIATLDKPAGNPEPSLE